MEYLLPKNYRLRYKINFLENDDSETKGQKFAKIMHLELRKLWKIIFSNIGSFSSKSNDNSVYMIEI